MTILLWDDPTWLRLSPDHTPLLVNARWSVCCHPRIDRLLYIRKFVRSRSRMQVVAMHVGPRVVLQCAFTGLRLLTELHQYICIVHKRRRSWNQYGWRGWGSGSADSAGHSGWSGPPVNQDKVEDQTAQVVAVTRMIRSLLIKMN